MIPIKSPQDRRCPWCGIDCHADFSSAEWGRLIEREGPRHGVVLGRSATGALTAEGGGMPAGSFTWLVGRWDNAIRRRPELADIKRPASDYLRWFHYDTISHSPQILRFMIQLIGASSERITTWTRDMLFPSTWLRTFQA